MLHVLTLLVTVYLTVSQNCVYSTNTTCYTCIGSYFNNNNTCQPCSNSIIGCLSCANSTSCLSCYYLYTLSSNICYYCPAYSYYNGSNCQTCISNCQFCVNNSTCQNCTAGYYYNSTTSTCSLASNLDLNSINSSVSLTYLYQYLLSIMPSFTDPVLTLNELKTICPNNGFTCTCTSYSTDSRCQIYNNTLVSQIFANIRIPLNNLSSQLTAYALAAQSQSINLSNTGSALTDIMNYFYPNLINTSNISSSLGVIKTTLDVLASLQYNSTTIYNLTLVIQNLTGYIGPSMNPGQTIILQGNGYIFKICYLNNQTSVASVQNYSTISNTYATPQTGYDYQFVLFDRIITDYNLSGIVITNNSFSTVNVSKTLVIPMFNTMIYWTSITFSSITSVGVTSLYNTVNTNSVATLSVTFNGYGAFAFSANSSSAYNIINQSLSSDPNAALRIQNLFYQSSILYILFFLLLYLILFPICLLVDFVDDPKITKRKGSVQREPTQQGLQHREQSGSEQQEPIPVTYKQFFPLYNVAATPSRRQRLLKLSLFLLNLQHSVTFLTILYYAIPKQAIWAILLAIPAYLMNIVMGYIVGFAKHQLPGMAKISINILVPAYWIIWVFLMRTLTNDFTGYLLIFVIVLFIIDVVFDLLQTMIMYFVLRQDSPAYVCLFKILAHRGYFEYDKYLE